MTFVDLNAMYLYFFLNNGAEWREKLPKRLHDVAQGSKVTPKISDTVILSNFILKYSYIIYFLKFAIEWVIWNFPVESKKFGCVRSIMPSTYELQ